MYVVIEKNNASKNIKSKSYYKNRKDAVYALIDKYKNFMDNCREIVSACNCTDKGYEIYTRAGFIYSGTIRYKLGKIKKQSL